ncbi:tubulin polyglutamylase TTLL11 [Electrophorus electricus]|uniref:Tubulin tyrosine ligase-like family, member 11 n=1 Tax=Electrophorus electricus TaxID=8005 RepID=A0A4W4ERE3_ELEEL|nr:tubulin polyglutamylase TTLL11 [Electrophorus electricus]
MSDHHEKAKVQFDLMKSSGEGADPETEVEPEQVAPTDASASLSPGTDHIRLTLRRETSRASVNGRNRSKSRGKQSSRDRNTNTKQGSDPVRHKPTDCGPGKGVPQSPDSDQTLQIKGTEKILQATTQANGTAEQLKVGKAVHEKDEGRKIAKKRRSITVDTSKAKTSLEALKLSIKQLKWKEFPMGRRTACDIYWHGVSFHDSENIVSGQVNKFPGMIEMLRKINLSRAVRTMQELFPEEYNFYPRSWILPEELQHFCAQIRLLKEKEPTLKPTFIVKPDSGSQGDGIYLIRDPADLRVISGSQVKQAVVQEYIQKPLLIDKLKFDVRLYVLVRSLEPLEIYIAKEGLSRFCTEPYQEPSQKNLSHVFMHLTNYSLNVHSGNFVHSDSCSTGSKRTFSSVLYRLASKGVDIKKVWSDIIALVIKTVIALVPELKVYYQADIPPGKPGPTCFQILGFDILLMKNLKPVLLEVNANPSMRIEHEQEVSPGVYEYVPSPVDEEVKVSVIRDTLRLMDPAQRKPHLSNLLGGAPEEAVIVEAGLDEKAEFVQSLPSLCLKQVFPKYMKQFNYLRIVEQIADMFLRFLGVKGTMKLGPTSFRTFIRNCKLSNSSFSMASVDILYIDITRRWAGMASDSRESGMCLQAFVEAFIYLASRRFKALPLREQVLSLLELCDAALEGQAHDEKPRPQKHHSNLNPAPAVSEAPSALGSSAHARHHLDCRGHQALQPSAKENVEN